MKQKLLCFLMLGILMIGSVYAQQRRISGTVTSLADGTPIAAVSVSAVGSGAVTSTGEDGSYSFTVPAGVTALEFRYLGYTTQRITLGASNVVNVTLSSDATTLDEVIVSGVAGATSVKKLTVSITKIGADQLNVVPATSIATSLSGKVAGVRISNASGAPGGQADMLLRADNNLNNVNSSPLIIMDGMIVTPGTNGGGIGDINPDDIESMEVIKGAAASALYGSRAGNGVIAITTKRGTSLGQNAVRINVRNEFGFQEIGNVIDLATHHVFALADDWQDYTGFTKYDGVTYPAGYYGGGFNPNINGTRYIKADRYMDNPFGVTYDQQDLFFNRGNFLTNYVSVANRSDKSAVFVSFENNGQDGVIMNTDGYRRQNIRVNYDLQAASWLKLSASNLYINTSTNAPGSGGGVFFNIALAEPDLDLTQPNPDGQPYFLRMNHFDGNTTNPLYNLYKYQRENTTKRFLGNYAANVKFADWVNLDVTQSFETQNYRSEEYAPKDTWTASGGSPENFGMSYTDGSLRHDFIERVTKNTQATLNLGHKFGDFDLKGKLSYLYENRSYELTYMSATEFSYIDVPDFDNFTSINRGSSTSETEIAQNYFAILGIDYKDKLLFDGMFRYDGSSLFGADARWNPYYRLSGAYRISEDVMIPGIDELKVRAAYGTAGIRPGFSWQYETYTFTTPGVASPSQMGNSLLRPSITAETEVGLNVDFLRKFSFEAVYARSTTTDQFLNVPLIPFLNDGFSRQYRNMGTVKSNTLEMTLMANWMRKENFTWNSSFVFSRVRQRISELPIPGYTFGTTAGGAQSVFRVEEGINYGAMYGHTWVRSLDQMAQQLPAGASIADYEVNRYGYVVPAGSIGTADEQAIKVTDDQGNFLFTQIGDGNARFNMGIANTFTYKGISLYVLADIKSGGDIYNSKGQWITRDLRNAEMDMSGVPQDQKTAYDYWVNFYDVNTPNSYWVEDGSFIKIRELSIGYALPQRVLNTFLNGAVKGARLSFLSRNLFTFTNYSGYDPEVGNVREPYDSTSQYPNFRTMSFSLSLDF